MYTVFSIIVAFLSIMFLGEMSKDRYCNPIYALPCLLLLFMSGRQLLLAALKWMNNESSWDYYNGKEYGNSSHNITINGGGTTYQGNSYPEYREKHHHKSTQKYISDAHKKAARQCVQTFVITAVDDDKDNNDENKITKTNKNDVH